MCIQPKLYQLWTLASFSSMLLSRNRILPWMTTTFDSTLSSWNVWFLSFDGKTRLYPFSTKSNSWMTWHASSKREGRSPRYTQPEQLVLWQHKGEKLRTWARHICSCANRISRCGMLQQNHPLLRHPYSVQCILLGRTTSAKVRCITVRSVCECAFADHLLRNRSRIESLPGHVTQWHSRTDQPACKSRYVCWC